ncbi:MAG: hypothetical protein QOK47_1701 [Actinomycetota bacterium]|nr:hypothetical protein [Actinomycetota bacterium]
MDLNRAPRPSKASALARVLIALGGAAMGLSVVFDFLKVEATGVNFSLGGMDVDIGPYFLAIGVFSVLVAIVLSLSRSPLWRVILAVATFAVACWAAVIGISNLTDLSDDSLSGLARQAGGDEATAVEDLRGTTEFDAGLGLYLGIGGAAATALGALFALKPRGSSDPSDTPLPAGWRPPTEAPVAGPTEPRVDPHAPWRPPDIRTPETEEIQAGRGLAPTDDPWRRREPPEGSA